MKDIYEKPTLNIMLFESGDVITTSGETEQVDPGVDGGDVMPVGMNLD